MVPKHNGIFSPEGDQGGGGGLFAGVLPPGHTPPPPADGTPNVPPPRSIPVLGEDGKFSPRWYQGNAELEPYAKQLDKFTDPAGLAKSYANLERNRMVPGEGAEESTIDAFRKANAIPATSDEYDLKFPETLPPGIEIDDAAVKGYKEAFHSLNLTPFQVQKLMERHLEQTVESAKAMEAKQAEISLAGLSELQKEWGLKFDANLATARKTFDALCTKAGIDPVPLAFRNDPGFAKLMATVSGLFGESQAIGAGAAGADLRSGKTEAYEIMTNPNHPDYKSFYSSSDPRHAEVQDRVARLNK